MPPPTQGTKLVVGLGNPEPRYEHTRHNLGFMVVEEIARRLGETWSASPKLRARIATARHAGRRIILLEPQTYMNLSGQSVAPALRFYDVALEDLLVVVDDTALPVARLRFRGGGSAGGHNGLKDIERALGTQDYARLRIGVGAPPTPEARESYVLGRFNRADAKTVADELPFMAEAVLVWSESGLGEAMNRFNRAPEAGDGEGAV